MLGPVCVKISHIVRIAGELNATSAEDIEKGTHPMNRNHLEYLP